MSMLKLSKSRNTKVPHFYHTEQMYFSVLILANILPFFFDWCYLAFSHIINQCITLYFELLTI